jgi:carboxyl-terminal processing protease
VKAAGLGLALSAIVIAGAAVASEDYAADFDFLWGTLDREYAYFDNRQVDWRAVREAHRARASAAANRRELVAALEPMLETLTDFHLHLRASSPASTRLVPSGTDVWAEWRGSRAIVTQVRAGHAAQAAGIRAGDELVALGGEPIALRVARRVPCCRTDLEQVRGWALLAELAGTHDTDRSVQVRGPDGSLRELRLSRSFRAAPEPSVSWRRLDGDVGYVRVTALGDTATVAKFDAALEALKDTRALVLDLSETAAGGNTDVAEPILGRFYAKPANYQVGKPRHGPEWRRQVAPRGPWTYERPVAVVVGRWTASMGEGIAIGFDGTGRGIVVGTPMARLEGAVFDAKLPVSGIGFNYPAERLFHVDGTPRERFVPPHRVDFESLAPDRQAGALVEAALAALRAP